MEFFCRKHKQPQLINHIPADVIILASSYISMEVHVSYDVAYGG